MAAEAPDPILYCIPFSAVSLITNKPTTQQHESHYDYSSTSKVPSSAGEIDAASTHPDSSQIESQIEEEQPYDRSDSESGEELSAIEVEEFMTSAAKIKKINDSDRRRKVERKQHTKVIPNAFVALPIKSISIRKQVEHLQNHLIKKEPRMINTLIPLNRLHITLMVIRLETENDIARAKQALSEAVDVLRGQLPLELTFSSLGSFGRGVLYADVCDKDKERLQTIASHVHKMFEFNGIKSTESRKSFTAHMTIAKISRQRKLLLKKINPDLYADWTVDIGRENIEELELLSMTKADESGYYFCYTRKKCC